MAAGTLLGHGGLVAVHAEDLLLVLGEAGARQRLGAGAAHKTVAVPWLLLVVHTSCGDWLRGAAGRAGRGGKDRGKGTKEKGWLFMFVVVSL